MLDEVLALLDATSRGRRLTIVAIDGPAYAGKSTLAAAIHRAWPETELVHVDDFQADLDESPGAAPSPEEDYGRLFDWERLRREVLMPLVDAKPARYRRPGWRERSLSGGWVTIAPRGVVIVEGLASMRRELRDFYSAAIFVDTPQEERMARASTLLGDPAAVERREAAARWYLEHEYAEQRADLVVNGHEIP